MGCLRLSLFLFFFLFFKCPFLPCVRREQRVLPLWILCPKAHPRPFNLFIFIFKGLLFLCVWVFRLHVCLCTTCIQGPLHPKEGGQPPGTGVTDSFQLPCGFWESNPGPLEELIDQCFFLFSFSFSFSFFFFRDRVSLYSPGWPGTHSVDQAGFELRNPPTSASQVLRLKACATTARLLYLIFETRAHCVSLDGLEFTEIHLPLTPEHWD